MQTVLFKSPLKSGCDMKMRITLLSLGHQMQSLAVVSGRRFKNAGGEKRWQDGPVVKGTIIQPENAGLNPIHCQ